MNINFTQKFFKKKKKKLCFQEQGKIYKNNETKAMFKKIYEVFDIYIYCPFIKNTST